MVNASTGIVNKLLQVAPQTRQKVLKVAISWAKDEHDELIDEKVDWWECQLMKSWLMRKLKGLMTHAPTDGQC